MTTRCFAASVAVLATVCASLSSLSAFAAEIAPVPAKLPASLVGCRAMEIPVDQDGVDSEGRLTDTVPDNVASAETVFEIERKAWMAGLSGSEIKRVGPLYVVMQMPPKEFSGNTWPGEICGRIDKSAEITGFTVKTRSVRSGYAGYCATNDPETCLESIYTSLRFTETKPWPRLPIYALWQNQDADPDTVGDIIQYFVSTPFDVVQPTEEDGTTQEFQIDNIQGCDGADCPSFPEAVDTTDGKGIAWFIELSEAELPPLPIEETAGSNEGSDPHGQ